MKRYVKRLWSISLLWSLLLICTGNAGVTEDRESVKKMLKESNWKEAYTLSKKLLTTHSDAGSYLDFTNTNTALQRLNKYIEFDELITIAREKHWGNPDVLRTAAATILNTPHGGQWIDNKYERSGGWRRGAQYANSHERDRVESLQLYQRAYDLEQDPKKKALICKGWVRALQHQRNYNHSWKLQLLTDSSKLPEVALGMERYSPTRGAPMNKDGNPIFYEVPATYAAAKNDGERWRWLLMETVRLEPNFKTEADGVWAGFLHGQFGVHTLQTFSWYGRYSSNQDADDKSGVMQVHTLKDNETVCRLANGVKRFELPQSQNFVQIYKNLWESGVASYGDQLVSIYLNRRQYKKAADLLAQILDSKGDDDNKTRQKRYDQITKDWGQFEAVAKPFTPDQEKKVSLIYRNAKEITLTLHEVDTQGVTDGIWKYLQTNPLTLDWNNTRWSNMLYDILNGNRNKYIGEQVAEQTYKLKPRKNHWDTRANLTLPKVTKAGAYLLRGETADGKKFYTIVWVDNLTIVSRAVVGGTWYYVTDSLTGAPVPEATLTFRGYLIDHLKKREGKRRMNVITKSFTKQTDNNGQVFVENLGNDTRNYQWMIHGKAGEKSAWLGMSRIWSWVSKDSSNWQTTKAFGITSQPVYKPGSTVEGKFWARQAKYDLGDKSTFANIEARIRIRDPKGQQFGKEIIVRTDQYGGFPFSVDIPEDATLGTYHVSVQKKNGGLGFYGNLNFRIEKYKKPEYSVSVDAPSEPVKLGDTFEATVKAKYYHGAPVTNAKVKVKIMRHQYAKLWFPYSRWDWLYGSGYGWLDIERPWYPGWSSWGCKCPQPFWYHRGSPQPELVLEEELAIGADGSVKVKVDTALAKMVHGNQDHRYEITAEVIDASRRTIFGSGSVLAARKPFQVTTWLNRGFALVGQKITANTAARTLDGRLVKGTGTATLNRVSFDKDGKLNETKVSEWELKQLPESFEHIDFKVDKAGQYRLVTKVKDEKGREIEGAILFTVRGVNGEDGDVRYNDLELIVDKREYAPNDKVKLLINTKRKNSTVVLFVRGSEDRRTIKIDGHSAEVELPVTLADMPNFFVDAITISDAEVHTQVREVIVPPQKRVLNIAVLPNNDRYKPREKGTVKIRVTGLDGEPVKGSCALAIYDKSLEYISGGSNVPEIRSYFWKWRRHYRNSGWRTSIQHSYQSLVKKGDVPMRYLGVFGRSLSTDFDERSVDALSDGESDTFGDSGGLAKRQSNQLKAESAPAAPMAKDKGFKEKQDSKNRAEGENAPDVMVRKDFADMIKWSGSVELDEDGVATVPVEYPDNLTTWKIKTWAVAPGTRVGEGSAEVITSKDLIIRLQAPRFFVEKDEVVLSAVVHNYHKEAKDADVLLELEGGTLTTSDTLKQQVKLAAENGEQRVNWRVKVNGEGIAIIRMKVLTDGDSDAMEMSFPVYVHGILKQMAWSRTVENGKPNVKFDITVPEERRPEESRLEIRYSPTVAGAMVDALPYLAEYPYGCTEQTLNRFVPTVITQKLLKDMKIDLEAVRNKRTNLNPQEIGDDRERAKQWKRWQRNPVFSQAEVDKMVRKGVQRLVEMQNNDGGWGWFSGYAERSYSHTTAVVVHGLKIAQQNGAKIPDGVIQNGVAWLKRYEATETEKIRMWKKREKNTKARPDSRDAFVRLVLAENGVSNKEMLGYQFRDKAHYGVYAKSLLGMSLHLAKDVEKRDAVIRNIEQFLVYDKENQTAYLEMGNDGYWWYWYGSQFEAHAWYLKLLAAVKPKSKEAQGIVKYLINNRKHSTYWNSTRDTAYCIEAIADYMKASGESDPNVEVEVLVDGKSYKKVKITKENLFSFDNKVTLAGDILSGGKHTVEIRRKGEGALYTNAYLTVFTKEDFIKKTGLEVKVERRYYKLVREKDAKTNVAGDHGQVVGQKVDKYKRIPLKVGDKVTSEDIIEVELIMESKNDYEYLMFSDFKAAGMEAEKVRSGYMRTGNMSAYMEVHDEKVCFFIRKLTRGKHSLTYRLRAEIPGKFSALPAMAEAMYAPELKANSDEMKVEILERTDAGE